MPKPAKRSRSRGTPKQGAGILVIAGLVIVGVVITMALNQRPTPHSPPSAAANTNTTNTRPTVVGASTPASAPLQTAPSQMEVKQAIMVTVELDFGPQIPSIANALQQIERRHQPDDGTGRVFAILDAYGEPTADGRKLHLSMHVSLEKTGTGSLVFRRTGETLWSGRVIPAQDGTRSAGPTGLTILLDDGTGRTFTVDGSSNPATILQAGLKESGVPVDHAWPDGVDREVTFLYSGCGCPVKVMCRRIGSRTVRTKDTPVIFPDDPDAVSIIHKLMAW